MPDRMLVAHEPYVGMLFHFVRGNDHWVLKICEAEPKIVYNYRIGISTLEEANSLKSDQWWTASPHTREQWIRFILTEGRDGADIIEVLDFNVREPDWRV